MADGFKGNTEMENILKWANEMSSKQSSDQIRLEYKDDGVYLSVMPPQGGAIQVTPDQLVKDIEARQVKNLDMYAVRQAAKDMTGQPVRIAPYQEELKADATVIIELSGNKMEAYLRVLPPRGGKPATRQDIEKALQEKNVVYGLNQEVIDNAVYLQQVVDPIVVARGVEPVDGENTRIEYKFNTDAVRGKPTEMMDGRVDYYSLNLIQNVSEGEVLAVKIPAGLGKPGLTVTGEEIPPKPGKDVQLAIGKNVELRENNTIAVATANGHVTLMGTKITVSNVYEVKGDVDFNTGNIEFNGTVIVKGSVREGFKVVADGDVDVNNTIADGIVECSGSLKVKNGIVGRTKSRIKAGGSVFTRFIENSTVESGGDVVVGEAIMHSKVSAKKSVAVGGKGVIVGGVIRAGEEINCKIVGSPLATATELEAGVNPELRREHSSVVKVKQAKEQDYEKATKAITLLKHLKETQGELAPDKLAVLVRVTKMQALLAEEIERLNQTLENIEIQIQQSERGRIMVQEVLHSGVKVTIGSSYMQTHDDYKFVCLTKVGEDIKISSYR